MNLVAAKNKQNLKNELEELQKAVKSSHYNSPFSTLNFGFIRKLFSKNDKKKSNEENVDRPLIQLDTNFDAQIPDENLSDQSHFAKVNNAGLLFIKLGETPPIYKFSKTFTQKFKPLSNSISLIDTIISTLNPINVSTSNGFIGILIDSDDLKILLFKCFTAFFKSKPSKESKKYEWKSPLIIKENEEAIAWIKCDLKISVKGKKYGKKKIEVECLQNTFLLKD